MDLQLIKSINFFGGIMIESHDTYGNDLVSIIVPAHNSGKYIIKCLASLHKQSYKNIEIIIINDGSTDQTQTVAEDFIKKDARFLLINQKNTGVSSARNMGINISKGKYLIFVDSDDYVTPDYVETLLIFIKQGNNELACADYYKVENDIVYNQSKNTKKVDIFSRADAINLLHNGHYFQGYLWNKIFLKRIITQNRISFDPEIKIWEDMLFCLKYLTYIQKIVYINKPIYFYVNHAESTMNNKNIWNEYTQLKALEEIWRLLQPYNGTFKEYIRNYYANTLAGLLGKKTQYKDETMINKLEKLHGRLTVKHRFKVQLYKTGLNRLLQICNIKNNV